MVTNSTPMPKPATKRQMSRPKAVVWQAMTMVASEYHSSAKVKIARRPNRSDSQENTSVPTNMPENVEATRLA